MGQGKKDAIGQICEVAAPVAFLAAALLIFSPFATIRFPGVAAVHYSGYRLLTTGCQALTGTLDQFTPEQRLLALPLFKNWFFMMSANALFALAGVVTVLVRWMGSNARKALFEKLEIGVAIFGMVFVGKLISNGGDCTIRTHGFLIYEWGLLAVVGAYMAALIASVTTFFTQFTTGGEYRVGTLVYNNRTLMHMFCWILWGDFCFMLVTTMLLYVLPLQLSALGLSPGTMALLITTVPNMLNLFVVPIISYKSDRFRSRWGRRIPFMALTAPFMILFLIAYGYIREISLWVTTHAGWFGALGIGDETALLLVIGALIVCFVFFNDFVNCVYWYLFADVVPLETMGRFNALIRMVSLLALFLFNAFIFKYAKTHVTAIYWCVSLLYLGGFGLMCYKLKEGEYPPVVEAPGKKPTAWRSTLSYFRDCFSHPMYVLFFVFHSVWAISTSLSVFAVLFYTETIGISMSELGDVYVLSGIVGLIVAYPAGALVDRFRPLPTVLVCTALAIPATFLMNFAYDMKTVILFLMVVVPINVVWDGAIQPLMVQVLPRDKYGQFCSANAMLRSLVRIFAPLAAAMWLGSLAAPVATIKPGESMRIQSEKNHWVFDRTSSALGDHMARVQSGLLVSTNSVVVSAAPGMAVGPAMTTALSVVTNEVRALDLVGQMNLRPNAIPFHYRLNPVGKNRACILPGRGVDDASVSYFISNASTNRNIVIRRNNWHYIYYWQCGFMVIGLICFVIVFLLWQKTERARICGAAAAH